MTGLKGSSVLVRAVLFAGISFFLLAQPVNAGEDKSGANPAAADTSGKVDDPFESK